MIVKTGTTAYNRLRKTMNDPIWRVFKLWTCPGCGHRTGNRQKFFDHALNCRGQRAYDGQG